MTIRLAHLAGLAVRKPAAAPRSKPADASVSLRSPVSGSAKAKPTAATPTAEAPSRFAHLGTATGTALAFVRGAAERQPLNKEAEASRQAAKILAHARANGAKF